ncbi:hypothetical protein [Microvirga sp. VF16]|uniref:hypothetical protein n=1 Tax=Microvirga sp. VF16 TaxID=2807101 RepID=UPI00193D9E84|nr:hypothetical protein [Microvirga sp. VF16]QRM35444.1 hypothetical protein JO965_44695 [Microvirga sp. VF16]
MRKFQAFDEYGRHDPGSRKGLKFPRAGQRNRGYGMDKAEIARRQLGKALALFIDDQDSVSVHCLACGGGEIAEHLTLKARQTSFFDHARKHQPDLDTKKIRRVRNQYWNAFKHATSQSGFDRQDEELLASFSDEVNDHTLFVGWYDYARASTSLPLEAQVFQVWYFAMYPEKLASQEAVEKSVRLFGSDHKTISRSEAKRRLRVVIESSREDREIMDDPMTENRPLDLGPIG